MTRQPYEFEIIVDNLPPCALHVKYDKQWQLVKDVLRSKIEERPKDPAEVTPKGKLMLCGFNNGKHAMEAHRGIIDMKWAMFCRMVHHKCHYEIHKYSDRDCRYDQQLHTWLLKRFATKDGHRYRVLEGSRDPVTQQLRPVPVPVARSSVIHSSTHKTHVLPSSEWPSSLPIDSSQSSQYLSDSTTQAQIDVHRQCGLLSDRRVSQSLSQVGSQHNGGRQAFEPGTPDEGCYGYHQATASGRNYHLFNPHSRNSSISTTSSSRFSSASLKSPFSPVNKDSLSRQPRSQQETSANSSNEQRHVDGLSESAYGTINGNTVEKRPGVSLDIITAVFNQGSNDRRITIIGLEAATGSRSLRHCLERKMHFKTSGEFSLESLEQEKGRAPAILIEFRKPWVAKQALEKLKDTKIDGKIVVIRREKNDPTKASDGLLDKMNGEGAAVKGPIIIDGSVID